ncbi:acyltransferase [Pseudonocardiaceae bacterium YIM PH 21723]|nr:acyltransferase [Pseudonocardiaceae bacterium YIM PH 21723]
MRPGPESPPATGQQRRFRPEIQGLRALAITLVVIYHVWVGRVSGGLDAFFLLSGFLLTGQLQRAHAKGGIRLIPLWKNIIARLLPAALTVLMCTAVACILLLPEERWFQAIKEIIASALWYQNWQLAADSVNYLARNNATSVVQHFWSLSLQAQFFLGWPLVVAIGLYLARRTSLGARAVIAGLATIMVAGSLTYSVWLTGINQPLAYFHTGTRLWEFGLGVLLALLPATLPLPVWSRLLLGWAGCLALLVCGIVFDVSTGFPGYLALWPTLAAAAVLIAGHTGSRFGADRLLSSAPLQRLGGISYALYLWHWPLLMFWLILRGRESVDLLGGVLVVGTALALAVLTHRFIEQPLRARTRSGRTRRGYRFGVLMLVPVLCLTGGWQATASQMASRTFEIGDPHYPGGLAKDLPDDEIPAARPLPPRISLFEDWQMVNDWHCEHPISGDEFGFCSTGPAKPTKHIVVAGDSHNQQQIAAILPAAQKHGWKITAMLKGSCPFSTGSENDPDAADCVAWNEHAQRYILDVHPDLVVTSASRNVRVGLTESTPDGFVAQWRNLADAGISVLAIRDNPRFDFVPALCQFSKGPDDRSCSTPRQELLADQPPYLGVGELPPQVSFLDLSDYLCDTRLCRPVVGNVIVYLDDNHVTASYMRTLSPVVERNLLEVLSR